MAMIETGEGLTVFVVDDDEAVRDSLAALLESVGVEAATFASGREFLAAHDGRRPGCLVLDLDLPDMTGLDLLAALAAGGARLPAILITGRRASALRARADGAAVIALLEKPFPERALLEAIAAALGGPRTRADGAGGAAT